MTKTEQAAIENIIRRLKKRNLGCATPIDPTGATWKVMAEANKLGMEVATRSYLDTWMVSALECLLPGPGHNPRLAKSLSSD